MREGELTYDDFLQRLNIQDVLLDAGYHLNKRDGLRYPSYVRLDNEGRRIRGDKFIVSHNGQCCFQPPQQKLYNVISFIKEHPDMFGDYRPGMSTDHLVNVVCNRLLNNPIQDRETRILQPRADTRPFNIHEYDIQRFNPSDWESQRKFYPYFKSRGIDLETQKAFHKFFYLATKQRKDGPAYTNLAFPMIKPGENKTVGLEERGRPKKDGSSYKGKAEGSNSSEALWIADFGGKPLDKVRCVVWFESAYDAMAEFQLDKVKDFQPDGLYVSTGGTPTERQIRGLLAATPNARHYIGFDKDEVGRQFVANFRRIADEMGFPRDNVMSWHPLGYYKDWNDALLDKKDMSLARFGETDYDYYPKEDIVQEETQHSSFRR